MRLATCSLLTLFALPPATAKAPSRLDAEQEVECSTTQVNRTEGAWALRALIDRCKETPSIAMNALAKLNMSPLPEPPRLKTAVAKVDVAGAEIFAIEAVVYFGTGETYPSDDGLQRLAALIAHINDSASTVENIVVVGGVDATEAASPIARDIARGRAESVRRYFLAAGVGAAAVRVALRGQGTPPAAPTAGVSTERAVVVALVVRRPLHAAASPASRPTR